LAVWGDSIPVIHLGSRGGSSKGLRGLLTAWAGRLPFPDPHATGAGGKNGPLGICVCESS